MRNARSNAQQILASTTEYHAIGPFAANEYLDMLHIQMSSETPSVITFSGVLHPTPTASRATLAAGAPIIETSDVQLAGQNAYHMWCPAQHATTVHIPLQLKPQSAPMWIHVAIFNTNLTDSLLVLMSITTSPMPFPPQGGPPTTPPAPPPPPPPPPPAFVQPGTKLAPPPVI